MISTDEVPLVFRLDWRDPASYDYTQPLSREGWAWEFLRRNPAYRTAYRDATSDDVEGIGDDRRTGGAEIWGLCSFRRSCARRLRRHRLLATRVVVLRAAHPGRAGARPHGYPLYLRCQIALPDDGLCHAAVPSTGRVPDGGTAPPACGAWRRHS